LSKGRVAIERLRRALLMGGFAAGVLDAPVE
jgi:hypothetical protein